MLQFCIFGGHEGPLQAEKKCYFTMFGACTLTRPTLARQIIAARDYRDGRAPVPKMIFITFCGATEIKNPTLAEEFIDLREAVRSRALDMNQWESYLAELDRWNSASFMSLTIFGSFEESSVPEEDEEIEGLALQHHFGSIGHDSRRILELGVGQTGAQRRSVIQQAVLVA